MKFDYSVLEGKIVEKYKTRANFARSFGLSERSMSLKMTSKVGWKQKEIVKVCEMLGVDLSEVSRYFFNIKKGEE